MLKSIVTKGYILNNKMVYFGLDQNDNSIIFKKMLTVGTENLSEYFSIIHAWGICCENHYSRNILTTCPDAARWVEYHKPVFTMPINEETRHTYKLITRAVTFTRNNIYNKNRGFVKIVKPQEISEELKIISSEFGKLNLLI